jgi:4-amino-4-deoxy-L-arabinose transferase-like glycosyltransferase
VIDRVWLGHLTRTTLLSGGAIVVYFALAKLAMHLLTSSGYGYFCDELYYLAMVGRLDFGYVDIPPLVPFLMALSNQAFGTSLFSLHIIPAIVGALTVLLAGLLAREMGGGRFAQALTALTVLVGPVWMALDSWFAYDAFDQLAMLAVAFVWVLLIKQETPRRWIAFGLIAGLAALTKLSMVFACPALAIALLVTHRRQSLATRWPWLAAGIALVIFSPFLTWQTAHGWPILSYWTNYSEFRPHFGPPDFILYLLLYLNPVALPLWLTGLYFVLFDRAGRLYRTLGIAFICLTVIFLAILRTDPRLLVSAFLPLIAGGAVLMERTLAGRRTAWLKPLYAGVLALSGLIVMPMALPIEPQPATGSGSVLSDSPVSTQFALRLGWPEMVRDVAAVYNGLSPEERARTVIYAGSYSQAAAIDFFGKDYGLPGAISNHLNYQVWGPGKLRGDIVIAVGDVPWAMGFSYVVQVATIPGPDGGFEWQRNVPIFLCRDPAHSLQDIWPSSANYR